MLRHLQDREIVLVFALVSVGISLRLIQISEPFIGEWSWRQTDVAMIAENFYRNGFNIFYPQINWAGKSPGYVGTEFPLVPFTASVLYLFFGVHEWIGRAVSVFFFTLSVPFLYLLVQKVFNTRTSLFAIAIYDLGPLAIFAGRSFMPDMTSLSLSIIALYVFLLWLDRDPARLGLLVSAGAVMSLAILVKLPAIIIGLPLMYMAWTQYGAKFALRKDLWGFAVLSLILPTAWYIHAYWISTTYSPHHIFGSGGIGLATIDEYENILGKAAMAGLTPLVSMAMLVGILLPCNKKSAQVFHWWLFALLLFAFIAAPGHLHNPWYMLPIVPVAATFAGRACDFVFSRAAQAAHSKLVIPLCSLIFFSFLSYLSFTYTRPLYGSWGMRSFRAGLELNQIAPRHALALVADGGDPTCLYYSRRKGWHFLEDFGSVPSNSQQAIAELEQLRKRGANYLVFTRDTVWWLDHYKEFRIHLDSRYPRVSETEDFVIFDLSDERPERTNTFASAPRQRR
jgi:hypothetical protein